MSESERVPAALQSQYDEIVALTDPFCQRHLNEEYRDLCRRMAATLCRKRPSPVATGKTRTWACGIVYSVGRVNFLFDQSQTPHLRAFIERAPDLFAGPPEISFWERRAAERRT